MPVHGGLVFQAKVDFLRGVHQPSDVYKVALYTADAALTPLVDKYTPTGEVVGQGYAKGGAVLRGYRCELAGATAVLGWSDVVWPNATIKARAALIYNASKGNRAIVIVDFGQDYASTNGPWELPMPPLDAASALVRIS